MSWRLLMSIARSLLQAVPCRSKAHRGRVSISDAQWLIDTATHFHRPSDELVDSINTPVDRATLPLTGRETRDSQKPSTRSCPAKRNWIGIGIREGVSSADGVGFVQPRRRPHIGIFSVGRPNPPTLLAILDVAHWFSLVSWHLHQAGCNFWISLQYVPYRITLYDLGRAM